MRTIEILISTMNQENIDFIESMNLQSDAVVINQNQEIEDKAVYKNNDHQIKYISTIDKGLSKSRNMAIKHASADICVIADDDMEYENDYVEKIISSYEKYPEADIIAFQVKRTGNKERDKKFRDHLSWENEITSMKISSVEITFKRKQIVENDLFFDPRFGAGTNILHGEENIFLNEAIKKNLNVLYLPINIAQVDTSESSWYEGFTEKYIEAMGPKYYVLSKSLYLPLILQFAIRKRKFYKHNFSTFKAIRIMLNGVKKYKKEYE